MSPHVAVVTDSTASLSGQLVRQWGIKVIQLQLQVDERIDDEARFDRDELVESLRANRLVATAPPDPGAFFWTYQDAVSEGATAIVSVHISGRMSATVEAARQAAEQIRIPVYTVDSGTVGMSLGFGVLSAARAAAAGAHVNRVIEAAERRFTSTSELIYVDTLEYLRRGGRIGAAQALLGTALSIKPLLTVQRGEVAPLSRVPGAKRAMNKLIDIAAQRANSYPSEVAVSCFRPTERELSVVRTLRRRVRNLRDLSIVESSVVVGSHVGPGAMSVTVSPV
ncbi:DegV family protein [Amycolatopsis pithecellobii]|uniref:DegV family EDD domain-containing protein n=1 Tax=Amycolatopsis pithecellobii TaxID=664692 RepID=A0A6N7Z9G6_9PSEU|nr:DegV family protein [Amycolatopsis pithecellobii]MTD58377.1 DegV family EDD domain-containing protein [Amycolatopsis pithecellobii]